MKNIEEIKKTPGMIIKTRKGWLRRYRISNRIQKRKSKNNK